MSSHWGKSRKAALQVCWFGCGVDVALCGLAKRPRPVSAAHSTPIPPSSQAGCSLPQRDGHGWRGRAGAARDDDQVRGPVQQELKSARSRHVCSACSGKAEDPLPFPPGGSVVAAWP